MRPRRPTWLAVLLLAGCTTDRWAQFGEFHSPERICTRQLPLDDDRHFWVKRLLDAGGGLQHDVAAWRAHRPYGIDFSWILPGGDEPAGPNRLQLDFSLPQAADSAAWGFLYADGRPVARSELRLPASARPQSRLGEVRAQLTLSREAGDAVPDLRGVRELRLITVDANGRSVADVRYALPDWAWTDRAIAESLPLLAAEAAAADRNCEPQQSIIIDP